MKRIITWGDKISATKRAKSIPYPKCEVCGKILSKRNYIRCVKHNSDECKLKKSLSHKGKTTWNKGKKCPETSESNIRERDNYICQICSQYGNYVHHIDYNKTNCNPNNLITLCIKCHSKTNFNREYWIKILCC